MGSRVALWLLNTAAVIALFPKEAVLLSTFTLFGYNTPKAELAFTSEGLQEKFPPLNDADIVVCRSLS